jgi:hypothetical protein
MADPGAAPGPATKAHRASYTARASVATTDPARLGISPMAAFTDIGTSARTTAAPSSAASQSNLVGFCGADVEPALFPLASKARGLNEALQ